MSEQLLACVASSTRACISARDFHIVAIMRHQTYLTFKNNRFAFYRARPHRRTMDSVVCSMISGRHDGQSNRAFNILLNFTVAMISHVEEI